MEHAQIAAQFGIPARRFQHGLRHYLELSRVLYRFYVERGFVPLRKEPGKA